VEGKEVSEEHSEGRPSAASSETPNKRFRHRLAVLGSNLAPAQLARRQRNPRAKGD